MSKTFQPRAPAWCARILVLVLGACATAAALADGQPQPPSLLYPELFDAVQSSTLYPDSKTFADAIPKRDPAAINAAYRAERAAAGFDLQAFVAKNFDEPEHAGTGFKTDPTHSVCQHVDALWSALTRGPDDAKAGSSLLPLPHRYVVPGVRLGKGRPCWISRASRNWRRGNGRFERSIWLAMWMTRRSRT